MNWEPRFFSMYLHFVENNANQNTSSAVNIHCLLRIIPRCLYLYRFVILRLESSKRWLCGEHSCTQSGFDIRTNFCDLGLCSCINRDTVAMLLLLDTGHLTAIGRFLLASHLIVNTEPNQTKLCAYFSSGKQVGRYIWDVTELLNHQV